MVFYECYNCGYGNKDKSKLVAHFNRKKICISIRDNINLETCKEFIFKGISYQTYIDNIDNIDKIIPMNIIKTLKNIKINNKLIFECKYCNHNYKSSQSLSNHKKLCINKLKSDEANNSMEELVKILNERLKMKDTIISEIKQNNKDKDKELNYKNKQINELIKKAGIMNNDNSINNGIINNIVINNYSNTDISHITEDDVRDSLKKWETCIPQLIEKIHYNPDKPENYNLYISNLNNKNIMLYENDKWNTNDRDEILDNIVDKYRNLYEEYKFKWKEEKKNYSRTFKRINNFLEHSSGENSKDFSIITTHISNKLYSNRINQ